MSGDSRERAEDASILGKKAEGEALRNIINKLSDERNLRDLHLKHYQLTEQRNSGDRAATSVVFKSVSG